jgi:hypothetical protein
VKVEKLFDFLPIHFLWTLHFLASPNPGTVSIATILRTNRTTLMKVVKSSLIKLLAVLPAVCESQSNQFKHVIKIKILSIRWISQNDLTIGHTQNLPV